MKEFDALPIVNRVQNSKIAPFLPIVWIALLAWIAFFDRLGSTGLVDETEPLFAEAAREMTVTGNWITPYFNGVTRFDKPPLIYWLMSIAYHTIGVNEWAARLPSALAGLFLVGFCFYVLKILNPQPSTDQETPSVHPLHPLFARSATLDNSKSAATPFLVAAIVALNLMAMFFGRLGYSDMLLNACFGGSLLSFFLGYAGTDSRIKPRWYLAFYVLMAFAVLTKGPVGIVLPVAIVLIFLVCVGKLRETLREMKPVFGTVIFLLISVPWYILVYLQNGAAFINSFFGLHNVERFTSVVNEHSGAWYYHWVIVLIGFFPWSLCLPAAIIAVLTQNRWRQQPKPQQLGLFACVWFFVVLGFFTIAVTKYITYSLPSLPAAAILVALWWNQQQTQKKQSIWLKFSVYFSIAVYVALAICILYSPNWLNADPAMPQLGIRLQQSGLPIVACIIWATAAIAGAILAWFRQLRWFWAINLIMMMALILGLITPAIALIDTERQLPLRQIAQATLQVKQPEESIVMATDAFEKPSLVFYTRQPITFLDRAAKILPYLEDLRQQGSTRSILMITTTTALKEADVKPNQYQFIQQNGVYQLVRVPVRANGSSKN